MARRQYGTGSVSQRHDHATCPPLDEHGQRPTHDCKGTWWARIEGGWSATGGRRRIVVSARTEAKCKARLRAKQRDIADHGQPQSRGKSITVKAWADQWLAIQVGTVRPSTYNTDASTLRLWVIPTIGTKRLDSLTAGDIRTVIDGIRAAGRKPSTILRHHATLQNLLNAARREGHAVPDSALAVKAPPKGASTRGAITVDETLKILKSAAKKPEGVQWAVAILQGIRPGEVLGLRWEDVDFDRETITVTWQLDQLPYINPKDKAAGFRIPHEFEGEAIIHLHRSYHLVPTKTAAGKRIIPLLQWMKDALLAWRDASPTNPWGLIFASTDSRYGKDQPTPTSEHRARASWVAVLAAAAVATERPYDLYEARHTTASLLLEAGVDPKVVVEIMGHTSIDTTRIYQHASVAKRREALGAVAQLLGRTE